MSRTDKTRPWWVQLADRPMVTCEPVHDHRFGPCTLPASVTRSSSDSPCHWVWTAAVNYRRHDNGAREWYFQRRADRRRSRHRARLELRAGQRED
jgi:hypothetical protein